MTHYIYQGKEISHVSFISLCQSIGCCGGRKMSHYEKLVDMAEKGNEKAANILNDLEITSTPNNNDREIGLYSPKNRYNVEVNFPNPLPNIGSVVSFGTMSIEGIEGHIRQYWMYRQPVVHVKIQENLKKYPEFEWKTVRTFDLEK